MKGGREIVPVDSFVGTRALVKALRKLHVEDPKDQMRCRIFLLALRDCELENIDFNKVAEFFKGRLERGL